jgi:hypothetical protein
MSRLLRWIPMALVALPACSATEPPPQRVTIVTQQGPWRFEESQLDMVRRDDGYTTGYQRFESALVEALLRAALAPVEPVLKPRRLLPVPALAPEELDELALEGRVDPRRRPSALLRAVYQGKVFDDDPSARIEITRFDGTRLTISSQAQHPLMLPWSVTRDGATATTWNPDISQALERLLPDGFLQRDRLSKRRLAFEVALLSQSESDLTDITDFEHDSKPWQFFSPR